MPAPGAYPIASTVDGRVRWSDGSVTGNMSTSRGYAANVRVPGTSMSSNNYQQPGQFLGSSTDIPSGGGGGGGGNVGDTPPAPEVPTGNNFDAQAVLQAQREAAQRRWQAAKEQAAREVERAKGIWGDTMGTINNFRDRSKEAFTNAGQEIVDTGAQQYGQGIESFNDLQKNMYNQFAARNIGLSDQIGQKGRLMENLTKQQGRTTAEIGRNNRENTLMYNQRGDQATEYEQLANQRRQQALDAASNLERMGYDNYVGDESRATSDYGRTLDELRQKAELIAQLKASIPGSVSQYSPTLNVQDYLGSITGFGNVGGGLATQDSATNVANPLTYEELLKRQRGLLG